MEGPGSGLLKITKRCNPCTHEKYYIIDAKKKKTITKNSELAST